MAPPRVTLGAAARAAERTRIAEEAAARTAAREAAATALADRIRIEIGAAARAAGEQAAAGKAAEAAGQTDRAVEALTKAREGLDAARLALEKRIAEHAKGGEGAMVEGGAVAPAAPVVVMETAPSVSMTPAQTAFEVIRLAEIQKMSAQAPTPPARPWDWLRRLLGSQTPEPPVPGPGFPLTIKATSTKTLSGPDGVVIQTITKDVANPALFTSPEAFTEALAGVARDVQMHGDRLSYAEAAAAAAGAGGAQPGSLAGLTRGVEAPLAPGARAPRAPKGSPARGAAPTPLVVGPFYGPPPEIFTGPKPAPGFFSTTLRVGPVVKLALGSATIIILVARDWLFNQFIGGEETSYGMAGFMASKGEDPLMMRRAAEEMRRTANFMDDPRLAIPIYGGLLAMENWGNSLTFQSHAMDVYADKLQAESAETRGKELVKTRGPLVQVAAGEPGTVEVRLVDHVIQKGPEKPSLESYNGARPKSAKFERKDGKPYWVVPLADAGGWIAALRGVGFFIDVSETATAQLVSPPFAGPLVPTTGEPTAPTAPLKSPDVVPEPEAPGGQEFPYPADVGVKPWVAPGFEPTRPATKPTLAPPD